MTANRFRRYADSRPEGERDFYQQSLSSWDASTLKQALKMADRLGEAGCPEPEGWVFSEIAEGIPQSARFALLKAVWQRAIAPAVSGDFFLEAPEQLLLDKATAVLTPKEKATLFLAIAKSLSFQIVNTLDEGWLSDKLPGWLVVEADADGASTGRALCGLHESILDDEFQSNAT